MAMSSAALSSGLAKALRFGANTGLAIADGDADNREIMLQRSMEAEISAILSGVTLFPPDFNPSVLQQLKKKLAREWDGMKKWTSLGLDPLAALGAELQRIAKSDVAAWLAGVKESASPPPHEPFAAARACSDAVWQLANAFETGAMARHHAFCARVGVSYATIVIDGVDQELSLLCRESTAGALTAVAKATDTDMSYSKATMGMCVGAACLRSAIGAKRKRGSKPLEMEQYESWFSEGLVFWTFSWKNTSRLLVKKLLHGDKALQRAVDTSEHAIDYAESVIDILSLCKGLATDYISLGLRCVESRILCTLSLVDIICDNVTAYCEHIVNLVSNTDEVDAHKYMRAANSMEKVGCYVGKHIGGFLQFDALIADLEAQDDPIVENVTQRFHRPIADVYKECTRLSESILHKFMVNCCNTEINRHCMAICLTDVEWQQSLRSYVTKADITWTERADDLLAYLEQQLRTLQERLAHTLMPVGARALWNQTCSKVDAHLRLGQGADYYDRVQDNVAYVESMFDAFGHAWFADDGDFAVQQQLSRRFIDNMKDERALVEDFCHARAEICENAQLEGNGFKLIISGSISDDQPNHSDDDGSASEDEHKLLKLTVTVHEARHFPICDHIRQSSDPYIKLQLVPAHMFPMADTHAKRTKVHHGTLDPLFEEGFHFTLPAHLLSRDGASLLLRAFDRDRTSSDDLTGVAYIRLGRFCSGAYGAPDIGGMDVPMKQLMSKKQLCAITPYQILRDRKHADSGNQDAIDQLNYIRHVELNAADGYVPKLSAALRRMSPANLHAKIRLPSPKLGNGV